MFSSQLRLYHPLALRHYTIQNCLSRLTKVFGLAVCWLFLLFQLASAQGDPALTQVVVKLNPLSGATIADINNSYRTTTVETLVGTASIYLLRVPAGINAPTLAGQMAGDIRLLYAEPNFVGQAPEGIGRHSWTWGGGNAAPVNTQYAVRMLGLPAAHRINRGAGAVVAVIDRGVQLDHPALVNRWTTARYDFMDDDSDPSDVANGLDEDGDGIVDDAFGHGTHVAGLVALVAPDAQIMPLRALDSEARGDIFRLAEAIVFATDQGADVINLSLGTARKANFANYGSWIDLAAPGVSIYSTMAPNGYAWWSGTSMATPLVAGQAALLHSFRPALNPREIAEHMAATALSLKSIDPTFGDKLGYGLPAVGVSLQKLQAGQLLSVGGLMSGSCVDPVGAAALDEPAVAEELSEPVDELALFNAIVPGDWADESAATLMAEAAGETMTQRAFLPLVAQNTTTD
jgi:subtilisin family serine protease